MSFTPDFRIVHVGVNLPDEASAHRCANRFEELFGLSVNPEKESKDASFTGTEIEWMKYRGLGEHGHIAIETTDLPAAREYLEEKGFHFIDDTAKYFPDGRVLVIYAEEEIGGFAIHLMQKNQ